jgi:hypothetical protein
LIPAPDETWTSRASTARHRLARLAHPSGSIPRDDPAGDTLDDQEPRGDNADDIKAQWARLAATRTPPGQLAEGNSLAAAQRCGVTRQAFDASMAVLESDDPGAEAQLARIEHERAMMLSLIEDCRLCWQDGHDADQAPVSSETILRRIGQEPSAAPDTSPAR